MKRVIDSLSKHSVHPFAASLALLATACAGAGDTDEDSPPPFSAPAFGGAGQTPPPGTGGPAAQAPNPGTSGAPGTGVAPGNAEGNGGSLGIGAGSSVAPGVGSGAAGSASVNGGAGGAPGAAGSAMVGVAGNGNQPPSAGPGRVGAELCPPGPFGNPIAADAEVDSLFTLEDDGFFNFEGPVWVGDALYFSEVSGGSNPPPSRINRYVPGSPSFERGVFEATGSNGLAVDASGNLLAATHDLGAISTFELPGGARGQIGAQTFNGQRFNSPNDLVLRGDGNLYFTDPSFQAPGNPQGATRVYRIAPDGTASVVDDSLGNPNGITMSPDGNTLYVAADGRFRRYDLASDGTPSEGSDIQLQQALNVPDGMAVDCAGNIYVTEHNLRRIRVFDPAGNQLGVIGENSFPANVTNVAFGGPSRTTLYITTLTPEGGGVFAVETNVPGLPY